MAKEQTKEVMYVDIKRVVPDAHQPRRNFDPKRLGELIASIKQHGIKQPMSVQARPDGTYLLVDGERRYRSAVELGMKKVPVVVEEDMSDVERLVLQFHLQEQHEGWSGMEKAVAIGQLSEGLGMKYQEMAKLLSLPERTIREYLSFWTLLARKEFMKEEISLSLSERINVLTKRTKEIYEDVFEELFTDEMQKELQLQVIRRIKDGQITNRNDITRIIDSFKAEPDTINAFIKGKQTVKEIFKDSNAKVAYHLRNATTAVRGLDSHLAYVMADEFGLELMKTNPNLQQILKRAHKIIGDALRTY